ncbi:TM2 domain-containing protein, partial [Clostridium perfringens]
MKKFKSKKIFVILAILLGNFGLHQLYIANYKKALIYFVFSWTGIPYILSIYDIFTIRKQFNKIKKTNIIKKKFNKNNKEICQLSN